MRISFMHSNTYIHTRIQTTVDTQNPYTDKSSRVYVLTKTDARPPARRQPSEAGGQWRKNRALVKKTILCVAHATPWAGEEVDGRTRRLTGR